MNLSALGTSQYDVFDDGNFVFLFGFCATQEFLLALSSEITPSNAQGTLRDAEDQISEGRIFKEVMKLKGGPENSTTDDLLQGSELDDLAS